MPAVLGKIWLLVSMLLGVVFVWAMTNVYQIDTVPTQYNGYTTVAFFMTMLLSGPLFAGLLLRAAGVPFNANVFAGISVLALLVSAGVIVLQGLSSAQSTVRCNSPMRWYLTTAAYRCGASSYWPQVLGAGYARLSAVKTRMPLGWR